MEILRVQAISEAQTFGVTGQFYSNQIKSGPNWIPPVTIFRTSASLDIGSCQPRFPLGHSRGGFKGNSSF